jgi:hypothetical protein
LFLVVIWSAIDEMKSTCLSQSSCVTIQEIPVVFVHSVISTVLSLPHIRVANIDSSSFPMTIVVVGSFGACRQWLGNRFKSFVVNVYY